VAQYRVLVPEHQELGILACLTPGQHHQAAEQAAPAGLRGWRGASCAPAITVPRLTGNAAPLADHIPAGTPRHAAGDATRCTAAGTHIDAATPPVPVQIPAAPRHGCRGAGLSCWLSPGRGGVASGLALLASGTSKAAAVAVPLGPATAPTLAGLAIFFAAP
jgi:hypothetical protein